MMPNEAALRPIWWEEASSLSYFYDHFRNMDEVDSFAALGRKLLLDVEGSYFIRPSLGDPKALAVTVLVSQTDLRHFRIHLSANRRYMCCGGTESFAKIIDLVNFHSTHGFGKHHPDMHNLLLTYPILKEKVKQLFKSGSLAALSDRGVLQIQSPFTDSSQRTRQDRQFIVTLQPVGDRTNQAPRTVHVCPPYKERPRLPVGRDQQPYQPNTIGHRPIDRPPLPPPPTEASNLASNRDLANPFPQGAYGNRQGGNRQDSTVYSDPTPISKNRLPELMQRLKIETDFCDCGIHNKEAVMPLGWTLHIDRQNHKLFFQNNSKTAWNLPDEAKQQLTDSQKGVIEKYTVLVQTDMSET